MVRLSKVLYNVEDCLSWGLNPGGVETFVDCVYDDDDRVFSCYCEHFLQTVHQGAVSGLSRAVPVCRIETVDYVATRARGLRKLY